MHPRENPGYAYASVIVILVLDRESSVRGNVFVAFVCVSVCYALTFKSST